MMESRQGKTHAPLLALVSQLASDIYGAMNLCMQDSYANASHHPPFPRTYGGTLRERKEKAVCMYTSTYLLCCAALGKSSKSAS